MKFQTKYQFSDYVGKKIFYVIPIAVSDELAKDSSIQWVFRCDCGKEFLDTPYRVLSGHKKSCGCMRYKNIKRKERAVGNRSRCNPEKYIGLKNNKLTVIGYTNPEEKGRIRLHCKCDCGREAYVYPYQFSSGKIQSCGCARIGRLVETDNYKRHGLCKDKFYSHWLGIKNRCYCKNSENYERYGGRGIRMCEEWEHNADNFIKWCHETHPGGKGLTIDRIDNNGPYSPQNCRWATMREQSRNKRSNRFLTYNGETKCLADWSKEYGICDETIRGRLARGWPVEKALATPVKSNKK